MNNSFVNNILNKIIVLTILTLRGMGGLALKNSSPLGKLGEAGLVGFLLFLCTGGLFAQTAPTDEQLKTICRETAFEVKGHMTDQERYDLLMAKVKAQGNTDFRKITAAQVGMTLEYGGISLETPLKEWLRPIVAEHAASSSEYAYWNLKCNTIQSMTSAGLTKEDPLLLLLNTKGLEAFLTGNTNCQTEIVYSIANVKAWNDELAAATLRFITLPLDDNAAVQIYRIFNSAFTSELSMETKQQLREAILKKYQDILATTDRRSMKRRAEEQAKYLSGPYASGTLVGGPAPEMHFRWYSDSISGVKKLSDLKGKVVLIDFWGTKCAPCIAAFPEMAELQQHYKDNPDVVILGITYPLGYITTGDGKIIYPGRDVARDCSLMGEYMQQKGITWTIAVSEENVIKSDYGVLTIPHIAIIDREGRVAYNKVVGDNTKKIELIDELRPK